MRAADLFRLLFHGPPEPQPQDPGAPVRLEDPSAKHDLRWIRAKVLQRATVVTVRGSLELTPGQLVQLSPYAADKLRELGAVAVIPYGENPQ